MTPSAKLYAEASATAKQAEAVPHERDFLAAPGTCLRSCRRCRLEARARVFTRAGDSAATLESRP